MTQNRLPDRLFSLVSPRVQELRLLDAAISILQQILGPIPAQSASRMAVQLDMLLAFLRNEGLTRKLYAHEQLVPNTLHPPGVGKEDHLRQVAEELLSRLQTRRQIVGAKGFLRYRGLRDDADGSSAIGATPTPAIPSTAPDDSQFDAIPESKQKIWENAFLASLTERLYGSASFRFLGILLVAAVFLAGAGTFFIGSQGLKLRENLEAAADRADKSIRDETTRAQAAINAQREALATALRAIEDNTRQFNEKIAGAQREVDRTIADFRNDAGDLRKRTIDRLVEIVRSDLDNQTSRLRVGIENYAASRKNEIVTPAEELRTAVTAALAQLPDLQEKTKLVADAAANAENVAGQLITAAVLLDGARTNSQAAAGHATAAATAAVEAERQRKRLFETLQPNEKKLLGLHETLGAIRERLRVAQDGILKYEAESADIKALQQRIGVLKNATSSADGSVGLVDKLQQQARRLCQDLQRLRPRRAESTLSKDEWILIQQNLTARGFKVVKIDGKPGPLATGSAKPKKAGAPLSTREAIRKFQASVQALPTGELTTDQIGQLLGLQATDVNCETGAA